MACLGNLSGITAQVIGQPATRDEGEDGAIGQCAEPVAHARVSGGRGCQAHPHQRQPFVPALRWRGDDRVAVQAVAVDVGDGQVGKVDGSLHGDGRPLVGGGWGRVSAGVVCRLGAGQWRQRWIAATSSSGRTPNASHS